MSLPHKPELKVDWCSYKAAKYAVKHWHYSKRMPTSTLNIIGVWENDSFIGVVIFGHGVGRYLLKPYGLEFNRGCELVRVALRKHKSPVSQIVSYSIKLLKKKNPKLRLVVSFADPDAGHYGGIYQAGNWIYNGKSPRRYMFRHKITGELYYDRSVSENLGIRGVSVRPSECTKEYKPGKFRYLYPLDRNMRKKIEKLRKPYPKQKDVRMTKRK